MKTPKKFTDLLKQNIITYEMLGYCIYSCNKRAKNYRDKAREYRHYRYAKYNYEENATEQKEKYYMEKADLLSILKPTCIHKIQQERYDEMMDIYFLNYDVYGFSFHSDELSSYELKEHSDLEIKDIGDLNTTGRDINDLISTQFVEKVLKLIETKQYVLAYALPQDILRIDCRHIEEVMQKYKSTPVETLVKEYNTIISKSDYFERLYVTYLINTKSPKNYRHIDLEGIIVPDIENELTIQQINELYNTADKELRKYGILLQ